MSKDFKVKNGLQVTTHITASGNISSSGDIFGNALVLGPGLGDDSFNVVISGSDGNLLVQGNGGDPNITIRNSDLTTSTTQTATLNFDVFGSQVGSKIVAGKDGFYLSNDVKDSNLQFYTATNNSETEKLRITTDGNVGIGTTEPGELLTVHGNISSSGTMTMLTASIGGGTFTSASLAGAIAGGGTTTNALTAGTGVDLDSGTTFDGSGAKTINLDLTEVITNDGNNRVLTSDGDGTLTGESGLTYTDTGLTIDGGLVSNNGNDDVFFQVKGSSDNNLLQVNPQSNDKVGIGTETPNEKLTVFGNIDTSGSNGHISASGNISASGHISASNFISNQIRDVKFSGFFMSTTSKVFIPINGTLTETANYSSQENDALAFVAPYDGYLDTVVVRVSDNDPGLAVVALHKSATGTEVPNSNSSYTSTVTMTAEDTAFNFPFGVSSSFSAGEIIAMSFDPFNNPSGNVNMTMVFVYDITQGV